MATTMLLPFNVLSDDTLAHVVSFLDYASMSTFTKETFAPLTERFLSDSYTHVWRQCFARQHFSPVESVVDYMQECKERRELVQNLVGKKNTAAPRHSCFNLPNRFFHFLPIVPNDDNNNAILPWNDPPPVDFDCNSYVLTSTACSGELLFLDPFDMSLSIHCNVTDNAVASEDAMICKAMMNAACAVVRRQSHDINNTEERDEHVAGAVIDETVYRNHNVQEYRTPPSQVLIDAQDYFTVNLAEYFHFTEDRHARRRTPQGHLLLHEHDEVDFGYIGIEAKPIVSSSGEIEGTMVGLGRFLCSLHVDGPAQDENVCCTEIVTWNKLKGESLYGNMRICRVPWDLYCADTCSKNNRLYVVYYRGQGPLSRRVPDDHVVDDTDSRSPMGRKTIMVYPLVPADETTAPTAPRYFAQPEFEITCSDFVSYVTVDCTGNFLLVGTNNGTVEIWRPDACSGPTRVALLNSKEATIASVKRFKAKVEALSDDKGDVEDDEAIISMEEENHGVSACMPAACDAHMEADGPEQQMESTVDDRENDMIDELSDSDDESDMNNPELGMEPDEPAVVENDQDVPRILGSEVDSFFFPDHLPIEECGFVSLQHCRVEGTSLLLWKKVGTDTDSTDFQVVSQINLPLSPRRKPSVHYDGRRIIVLGEDHIGVIILVYHVLSSMEDIDYFPSKPEKKLGQESGGLYNYTMQPRVRFANRIRHAALGGLERFEAMYMTCNERYIIVNTKTGNLLGGGSSPTGEGLLVIDLQEHE